MSRRRATRALVVIACMLLLAACSGGGSAGTGAASGPSTTTTAPTKTTAPVPGASDTCPGFRGATTELASTGPTAPAVLVDATAGGLDCLDVVTFTFETRGDGSAPGYQVSYRDQTTHPFMDGDPPTAIDVPGKAQLAVTISPATSTDPAAEGNPSTYSGNQSLRYDGQHHLEIVRELPDAKGADGQNTVNWVIGLDSVRPFRVDRASNPPRVVVLIG